MVALSTNRLGKIYTSGSTTVFSSIDWDLRATFNGSNIFFFVILDACVCVFFFPQPRTYTVAALGRYLFMNPKLHCSRDASVSHDRLRHVAARRKLHEPGTVPHISWFFRTVFPLSPATMQMLSIFELQNARRTFK